MVTKSVFMSTLLKHKVRCDRASNADVTPIIPQPHFPDVLTCLSTVAWPQCLILWSSLCLSLLFLFLSLMPACILYGYLPFSSLFLSLLFLTVFFFSVRLISLTKCNCSQYRGDGKREKSVYI